MDTQLKLYSTGNYNIFLITDHEKESDKESIRWYVYKSKGHH